MSQAQPAVPTVANWKERQNARAAAAYAVGVIDVVDGGPYHADLDSCKEQASKRPLVALSDQPDALEEVGASRQHRASVTYVVVLEMLEGVATSGATSEAGRELCMK